MKQLYFARQFVTGNVAEKVECFNSLWQYPQFRTTMRVTTLVWGIVFVLEVTVRTYLVFTLTIAQSVVILPIIWYVAFGGVMLWTMPYTRRERKQREEAQAARLARKATEEKNMVVTDEQWYNVDKESSGHGELIAMTTTLFVYDASFITTSSFSSGSTYPSSR